MSSVPEAPKPVDWRDSAAVRAYAARHLHTDILISVHCDDHPGHDGQRGGPIDRPDLHRPGLPPSSSLRPGTKPAPRWAETQPACSMR